MSLTPDSPAKKTPVFLTDYQPPAFLVETLELDVHIETDATLVTAILHCQRNPASEKTAALILDGEALETLLISVDERELAAGEYRVEPHRLIIDSVPDVFVLTTKVRISPDKNTQLSGFYRSRDGYFTQCEPQGFRRITWFLDRPDVMARYTVTLHADKARFPVLLSNGNLLASGEEADGRHFARWQDPFKKPSYLFAMVAGKLDVLQDSYQTSSGRTVQLAVYVEPGKLDQCAHAMSALKKSMRWDEENFGLECDLDQYMIVAVSDFNMGAMENKGLNIFNTKYVLARPDVATDTDFENIDRVVAHEYFHNWTGNRVTCRDWFQLSLKEGLTVFRDQEFGADTHNASVARIREVRNLRAAQFPEDAGIMAHPVRPSSYLEINNFYTTTVYEKGAELVRMLHTLIGKENFRRGMAIYFERHDGQAASCDDFVNAMAAAYAEAQENSAHKTQRIDFAQFMRWYAQAGTPHVSVTTAYDPARQRYELRLTQLSPSSTPEKTPQKPLLIPISVSLLGAQGQALALSKSTENTADPVERERLLLLTEFTQSFIFEGIAENPVPSLLRNFSAPVILNYADSDAELMHRLAHDSDPFNRWEAGQRLFSRLILAQTARISLGESAQWPDDIIEVMKKLLLSESDPAFVSEVLTLPSEATLAEQMDEVDPEALYLARTSLSGFLANGLARVFLTRYAHLAPIGPYRLENVAARRLRNLCLSYLNELDLPHYRQLATQQFDAADNMTDQFAALVVLVNSPNGKLSDAKEERERALAFFYKQWSHEALVVDKWLSVQAACQREGTLAQVQALVNHPAFDAKNPNKIYALLRTFGANHRHFHAADGSGYHFLAEQIILLDGFNPQVASRLARCFDRWAKFDEPRRKHAKTALQAIKATIGLSDDVSEIIEKALR